MLLALQTSFASFAAPAAPEIAAPAGTVIDMNSGIVLYAKDADTPYYPASITKTMTALLVVEKCSLDETVTFSKKATTNLESGAVTISLQEGDKLTVRECLYALLLKSANEVANGLAEHVAGSVEAFAELMNAKAASLGCTHTHFVNPNGLNDSNHYTTAHDMALIGRAAFANEIIRKIDTTESYKIQATKKNPKGITVTRSNKILNPSNECYYPYAIASKTGYTSRAGSTLVTAAEKDGKRLVAVILKSTKYLGQYADTKTLLDYGFEVLSSTQSLVAGSGNSQPVTGVNGGPGTQSTGMTENGAPQPAPDTAESSANAGSNVQQQVQLVGPGGTQ